VEVATDLQALLRIRAVARAVALPRAADLRDLDAKIRSWPVGVLFGIR
jgi:hypothetical protein